ncbi:MAG TPA: hypothetical protein EYG94_07765 [Campylobacterales bacterium]|nr:hypothetical protein [Campylobacterales bacterium]
MQTLHLRAESEVLEKIIAMVNQFSLKGDSVEILDNLSFNMEKKMILKGLTQEKNGETISHDDLWNDLLA